MITLGITGRSGCGKSTVTAVFAAHGVPLADADQLSREILLPGSPLLPQLAARFGGEILRPDGTLDRRLLADRAFASGSIKSSGVVTIRWQSRGISHTGRMALQKSGDNVMFFT